MLKKENLMLSLSKHEAAAPRPAKQATNATNRETTMTRRSVLAAMLAVLGLLAAGSAGAAHPVRIGYAIAKTGMFAPAAQSQINAYLLWADQVNQQGGLDVAGVKRPVEFVVYDDQSDFGKAPGIYEKLITNDKVDLLLAPWGTPFHFAIAGVLERYKFPMVGNSAASVALREVKPGNIWFPTSAIPEKTDIKIVVNEEYAPGVKDMTATLTKIKQAAPDAVLSLSYPPDSILYMKQAREIGIAAPFQLVLIGPTADFFGKMFGVNLDGVVTVGHWSPAQKAWPKAKPFFDAYKAKFGEAPDYLDSALAYMSCEILQQAVAKAGLDKDKLREVISTSTFDTIDGPVAFDGVQNKLTPAMFL